MSHITQTTSNILGLRLCVDTCDVAHSFLCHDPLICVTWLPGLFSTKLELCSPLLQCASIRSSARMVCVSPGCEGERGCKSVCVCDKKCALVCVFVRLSLTHTFSLSLSFSFARARSLSLSLSLSIYLTHARAHARTRAHALSLSACLFVHGCTCVHVCAYVY